MPTTMIGQNLKRREDRKYLTGQGAYLDDVTLPGLLYVAFVRSPYAHARIKKLDATRALAHPKAVDILTGSEAVPLAEPMPVYTYMPAERVEHPVYRCLATDRVRFVGEPVAAVAANGRYSADDVAELVQVDYEPLDVILDPEKSLEPGAPKLHENLDNNIGLSMTKQGGDLAAAFHEADFVFKKRIHMHRHVAASIEPRGAMASYNPGTNELTLWATTSCPHVMKSHLAEILRFPEHNIRVIAHDIGGAFGSKLQVAPEYVTVCLLAMKTGRPVKWVETRRENLMAFVHARDQIHYIEIPMKRDGTILGIKDRLICDAGAYLDARISGACLGAALWLTGPYKMKGFHSDIVAVMTNKCPHAAYRGFGSEMGVFVIERAVSMIARELGMDPAEIRRKNLIQEDELPYKTASGNEYDSGNYPRALDKALEMVDYSNLRKEQARLRKEGRHIGIGVAMAVEGAGWNTYTAAMARAYVPTRDYCNPTIRMDASGCVTVLIGDTRVGTGHATTAAQVVADSLGVNVGDIEVIEGDTAITPYDSGTRAARFSCVVIPALAKTAATLKRKIVRIAGHLLEASADDIVIEESVARVKGVPGRDISVKRLAQVAFAEVRNLPPDVSPGLEASENYTSPASGGLCISWPYSVHVPVVEVDVETGKTRFLRYAIVHDCGVEINPRIVEAQMVGGTAQGIGGTIMEELVYDENGQLLTTTFMDYLLPTALDIPNFEVAHMCSPAPQIPGGFKGMGEGGCVYSYAAVANAIADAIEPLGVEVTGTPLSPPRILGLLRDVRTKSGSDKATK